MKYYSEKLNKFYDSADECQREEFELKEKENREKIRKEREAALAKEQKEKAVAERKEAAAKVDAAFKTLIEAKKAYNEELQAFCKKYGTYHFTTDGKDGVPTLFDFFENIFKF